MVAQWLQSLPDSPLCMVVTSYEPDHHEEKDDSASEQPLEDYAHLVVDQSRLASNLQQQTLTSENKLPPNACLFSRPKAMLALQHLLVLLVVRVRGSRIGDGERTSVLDPEGFSALGLERIK